jgi:hypothetical protein
MISEWRSGAACGSNLQVKDRDVKDGVLGAFRGVGIGAALAAPTPRKRPPKLYKGKIAETAASSRVQIVTEY